MLTSMRSISRYKFEQVLYPRVVNPRLTAEMVKTFKRKKSRRLPAKQKYKVEKKVREHKRKLRKEQKKKGKSKLKKDPGIPNLYPFKEQLLQQIEDRRQQEAIDKQKEKEQRKSKLKSLKGLQQDAQKRSKQFEKKQEWEEAMTGMQSMGLGAGADSTRRAYYREFHKVVEMADVVLEVLDARDPLGCRCPQVEKAVLSAGANKKLVLILNKIDLVPRPNVEEWLKHLRSEFPAVAFKASTQSQKDNLSRKAMSLGAQGLSHSSPCCGADVLMKLLGNYCRNAGIRTSITVGVVGLPNVGKSSIINSLKRSKACSVGATPGVTKAMQEVQLDKHVKLLDSPGIVMAKDKDYSAAILRNSVRVESLSDVVTPVEAILRRCNRLKVMEFYCIPEFADVHEFLSHVARRHGRLKKGGVPDVDAAAKVVLHDWNSGKISFYTHPPDPATRAHHVSAEIVHEWSAAFDLKSLEADEQQALSGLPESAAASAMVMEPSQPAEMADVDSEGDSEVDNSDDDDASSDDEEGDMNDEGTQESVTVEFPKQKPKGKPKTKAPTKHRLQTAAGGPSNIDGDVEMDNVDDEQDYSFTEYFQ